MTEALAVVADPTDPHRLRLRGSAANRRELLSRAPELLAASPSPLILDVGGVTNPGADLVRVLNGLATHAGELGTDLVVEVPDDADGWLAGATLHPLLRVVRTSPMPVVARRSGKVPPAPTPARDGQARREGRGFIASYGPARLCAADGCWTRLSRYNSDATCASHDTDGNGPFA